MAKNLNIATSTYQYYERGERDTPGSVIKILTMYGVNPVWMIIGDGPPYLKDPASNYPHRDGTLEIQKFLEMTREVLSSETDYGFSLKTNIQLFHQAMKGEKEYKNLEKRIAKFERTGRRSLEEERIRVSDPPEKKEEIIKRRAMSF